MTLYHVRMRDVPEGDRPRERLREYGPESLSDTELLAILLRVGSSKLNVIELARQLLNEFGGWRGLQRADFADLVGEHSMGEAKTAQVKAALEIGRRLALLSPDERMRVSAPRDIAALMQVEMAHLDQEILRVVCLDTKHYLQKITTVYQGSLNMSLVRVGEIFKEAIRQNSASIIVVHNHPSGDPSPSTEDIAMTEQLVHAGRLLDVTVLDHMVIGHGRYTSLREKGLGGFED